MLVLLGTHWSKIDKLTITITVSAHIECRRSIKFYDFWAVHNGHFWPILVQKYPNLGQNIAKNDQSVPKLCPMAF